MGCGKRGPRMEAVVEEAWGFSPPCAGWIGCFNVVIPERFTPISPQAFRFHSYLSDFFWTEGALARCASTQFFAKGRSNVRAMVRSNNSVWRDKRDCRRG